MPRPRANCLATLVGVALLVATLPAAGGAAVADSPADRPAVAATTGGAAPIAPHAPIEATPATGTGAAAAGNVTVTNVTAWNVTVWSAPRAAADRLTNRSAIRSARQGNLLTRDYAMAFRDTLVMELSAPGLGERMAAASGANRTERFLDVLYDEDSHLTLVQTSAFLERDRYAAQLTRSSLTVVPAERAETYYLVVDPGNLLIGKCVAACGDSGETPIETDPSRGPRLSPRDLSSGATLAVNVTVDGESTLVREDRNGDSVPILRFEDAAPEFVPAAGSPHVLHPSSAEPIRARTHLARDTALTIRITDRSDGGPSLSTTTTVVDGLDPRVPEGRIEMDNRIGTSLDTSELAPGTTFELRVVAGGDVLRREPAVIKRAPVVTNVTVRTAPAEAADRLTNRSAIRSARLEGHLTRDATVAMNDTLVFRLRGPGLRDRLSRADGANVTARFLASTTRGNGTFMLRHLNPGLDSPRMAARPNRTADTTVVAAANDTYYLVTRPRSLDYGYCSRDSCESDTAVDWTPDPGGSEPAGERVGPEDAFAVVTVFDGNRRVFGPNDRDADDPQLEYVEADATVRTDRRVEPIPWPEDGRVHVESTLASGTQVTVWLTNRSDGGATRSATTVLTGAGRRANGSVSFPQLTLPADATFTVQVIAHGRVIERANGLAGAKPTPTAGATPASPTDGRSTPTAEGSATEPALETTRGTGPGFAPVAALVGLLLGVAAARARRR